jgi:hypothetical protein
MARGDVLDEVFAAPLDEFVAARKRAVDELKSRGEAERAAEAAGLRKPTVPVWVVNQLARDEKQRLRALVEAADKLRKVQTSGDLARFDEAQAEFASALGELRERAKALLERAGRAAGDGVLTRISETLRAAATDPGSRDALEAGRLTEELDAPGFAGLAVLSGARPQRQAAPRKPSKAEKAAAREQARREKQAALEQELREAEAELTRTRRDFERAERTVARLRAALDR